MLAALADAARVVLVAAAAGAIVMAAWPRGSRRYGSVVVAVALLGLIALWVGGIGSWVPTVFVAVVILFWLVDRGIPGNRQRPMWVRVGAIVLVLLAIASGWTLLTG